MKQRSHAKGRLKRWRRVASSVALLMLAACATTPLSPDPASVLLGPAPPAYNYPIQNPYASTIITVPASMRLDYSRVPDPSERTLTVFPDRKIPEGFWYEHGLRYSTLLQDHAAPLVYVIAGTGADNRSEKMRTIAYILYTAGFHVVLLPSPTHQNFIINASSNYIIGRPRQSAIDLYRVMKMVDREVVAEVPVTQRMLTGYSLGALDAAFTAKLDDERHTLNFTRVLLINPPYSLYSSIQNLSAMFYDGLPHGMDDADAFIKNALYRLHTLSQSGDPLDFANERLLIKAYETYKPNDDTLASLIGLSFRLSAASMVFSADVMSNSGYVFPKDRAFTTGTDLTTSMSLSLRTSFVDYFNEYYTQKLMAAYPGTTKEQLVAESQLPFLDSYIRGNPKFGLITNRDDIILAPGEADKMAAMFGANAFVFSNGGHVGNLAYPTVGYDMVHFLRGGAQ